ncbi:MAG: NUDIX hydrolase [Negativicutes bacterium]|nr:NUDIX hydrolase [Negativicutes bacterium]
MRRQRFSYCPKCGGLLQYAAVHSRERLKCNCCNYIMYENPIVGVAVILQDSSGAVLLGRREKSASYPGLWCIPCGYVEYDEEVRQAACREFFEETGLQVKLGEVFTVLSNFHNPETHTVGIWFQAKIVGGAAKAGDDLTELGWFLPDNPPPLAFPTDQAVLDMIAMRLAAAE